MITKLKLLITGISLIIGMSLPLGFAAVANAATPAPATGTADTGALCKGATESVGDVSATATAGTCGGEANKSINDTTSLAINLFSAIVGLIAVIMIIVGGVKYVTSGGSSEKTTSAKDTILFAVVGLIVVALAQIIVKFVLHKATNL
jgi:hypothetical protein